MMTLSESLGQKCHPVSHAAPLKRNTPTPFTFLSLSPRQTGVVEKKKTDGRDPSCVKSSQCAVPSRLSVLLPSCLPHAFRGQSWSPRASTIPSVLCWFSKSLVCFFLSLVQTRSHLCHVVFVSMCYSHLVCSTHLVDRTWRPRASTILSVPCRLVQ